LIFITIRKKTGFFHKIEVDTDCLETEYFFEEDDVPNHLQVDPSYHLEKRLELDLHKIKLDTDKETEYIFEEDDIPYHLQVDADVEGCLQATKLTPTSEGQKQNHVCFSNSCKFYFTMCE
jgi:hypothetical protein